MSGSAQRNDCMQWAGSGRAMNGIVPNRLCPASCSSKYLHLCTTLVDLTKVSLLGALRRSPRPDMQLLTTKPATPCIGTRSRTNL